MATLLMSCYGKDESKGVLGSVDVLKRSIKQYFDLINNQGIEVNFNTYYEFLEKSFFPNNKDFDAFLNYQEFLLIMEKYKSSGQFGFLLNNDESFNLKSRWITFDLVGVVSNEDLASPTLLMVMYLFEKMKAIHYGNNVRMFIEEAVDFLQGGVFSDYIGGLYRKIRKYGGQVFIVTQSINFLDKLDPLVKDSIQENSEIKILLNHAKVSYLYDKLEKNLSLSKSEVELIKNQTPLEDSKYRIGFMKFGSMPGFLFRHEVSPETYSLYQTNADEIKKIDSLIEEMGSISGAVNTYVEQLNT
jgi:type IV secretory pathway VirB4 component